MMMSGLITNMAMSIMPLFDLFPSVVEILNAFASYVGVDLASYM